MPQSNDVVTSISQTPANVTPVHAIEEIDVDKIGFTVDVAMRLVANQLADQGFGNPVTYLGPKPPADLADSA